MPFSLYLRPQVTPYVILFVERDGSTYLTSLLSAHPHIGAVYERFAVLNQKGLSAAEQLSWLRDYYTPPLLGRTGAIGFKTKLVDVLDLDGFTQVLHDKQVKVIHMQRRNRIKAVVSRINARRLYEATGNWNLYKEQNRRPPMEIDLAEFRQFIQEREEADQALSDYVARLQRPHLLVRYEELQTERDRVLHDVFDFLRVPFHPVKGKTKKHTSDDLRDVVLNFDQLRTDYAGTPYEEMFDEVLAPG
jgi:LPS sulfotransferase NodH